MLDKDYTIEETVQYAKMRGWTEVQVLADLKFRIASGEDINFRETGNSTAVMSAAAAGYLSIVKLLIEQGADLAVKNRFEEDVVACAKLSKKKDVIDLIKTAIKAGGAIQAADPQIALVYFRPKPGSQAEYTFFPSKSFKKEHDSIANDVGFFLNPCEILKLQPIKPPTIKAGIISINIEEGKVTIHDSEWDNLNEKQLKQVLKNSTSEIYDIDAVVREYLSE